MKRTKNHGKIFQILSTLRNQKEQLGNPLIRRKDFLVMMILFSVQIIQEISNYKEFKGRFKELDKLKYLINVNTIAIIIKMKKFLHLIYHNGENKKAISFQKCQEQLEIYSKQEEYFKKLYEMKNSIYSLRFILNCIKKKILSFQKKQKYFQDNQKEFDNLYQLNPTIHINTYKNLDRFLKQNQEYIALNMSEQQEITNYECVLDPFKKKIQQIQIIHSNFLNSLKPCKLKIILELIRNNLIDGFHLEAQQLSTLQDLFNWVKQKFNWDNNKSQFTVYIDYMSMMNFQQQYSSVQFVLYYQQQLYILIIYLNMKYQIHNFYMIIIDKDYFYQDNQQSNYQICLDDMNNKLMCTNQIIELDVQQIEYFEVQKLNKAKKRDRWMLKVCNVVRKIAMCLFYIEGELNFFEIREIKKMRREEIENIILIIFNVLFFIYNQLRMYKRIQANVRSKEEDEDFFEWNQMYVQQEMESDIECYNCQLCDRQFGKNEYELNAHINSHDHKKLEKEFRKRYNNLIIEYRLSTYSQRIGRKLKKLQYFKCIYEYK